MARNLIGYTLPYIMPNLYSATTSIWTGLKHFDTLPASPTPTMQIISQSYIKLFSNQRHHHSPKI